MNREAGAFSRLILFRPRPDFPLPAEWRDRPWIPLGELRPMLQAISPVRDLSDHWRWVALPLQLAAVEAVLAHLPVVIKTDDGVHRSDRVLAGRVMNTEGVSGRGTAGLNALLVPAAEAGAVERVELSPAGDGLLAVPSQATMTAMQTVAAELRRTCGCVAVGV